MAMAKTNVSLQQALQTNHQANPSLDSLFHALDPISLILNHNNNNNNNNNSNNSVFYSHHSVVPLSLTTQSFTMDMERGPRYDAYAELREKKLRMKYLRQQQREEEESLELEQKLPTPPRKQVKFQGNLRKGSSVLAQSVPDFSAVLRKENRKPVNVLPSVMELTPPPKSFSKVGGGSGVLSSSRGSKSASAGEKKRGVGGVLMARKSYANIDELKSFSSATANAINGEGGGRGGRSSRVVGRTVFGYRQF